MKREDGLRNIRARTNQKLQDKYCVDLIQVFSNMRFKKILLSLFFSSILLYSSNTEGQSLRGKVIYVSSSQEVILRFKSGITNYDFSPKESANYFGKKLTNSKNLSISSTIENFPTTRLIVVEGDNTHVFLLVHKENLDPKTETIYDFSSKEKLKKEAELLDAAPKDSVPSQPQTTDTSAKVARPNPTQEQKTNSQTAADSYAELTIQANNAYRDQKFALARDLYTQILKVRPNDQWSLGQLEAIKNKENAGRVQEQAKASELAFKSHIKTADSAFNVKSYSVARSEYNEALSVKENDSYAKEQLGKIDKAIKEDQYKSFMSVGTEALSNQSFEEANNAFNEALKIKPNDAEAKRGLTKILAARSAKAVSDRAESARLEKEKQFNDTVALADNMFQAGMYEQAKSKYVKAGKMKTGEKHVENRITEIDSILAKRKADISKLKQDSLDALAYKKEIEKGNKAFDSKDYANAKISFQKAQKLSPDDKYPAERISTIDVLLLQIEEQKKADANRKLEEQARDKQYNTAIKQGSAAMAKEDYEAAKGFYLEAQKLKPNEKLPGSQLQIINLKLASIQSDIKYETFLHYGDSSYVAKDYKSALMWYDSARILKPKESYPQKQILAVNQDLLTTDEVARKQKRSQEFDMAVVDYWKADTFRRERKYDQAYVTFSSFLNKLDTFNTNAYTRSQQFYINEAKDYLRRLEPYKPKPKVDTIAAQPEETDKKKKKKKNKDTGFILSSPGNMPATFLVTDVFSPYQSRMKKIKGSGLVAV